MPTQLELSTHTVMNNYNQLFMQKYMYISDTCMHDCKIISASYRAINCSQQVYVYTKYKLQQTALFVLVT